MGSSSSTSSDLSSTRNTISGHVKHVAYKFDGHGNFATKDWDLGLMVVQPSQGEGFSWYHVELPRSNTRLSSAAQFLIDILCPPLKLQDILSLLSNGPFCGIVDGALIFRVNSAGPTTSKYTHRLAVRVTEDCVITISLGRIPRLSFCTLPGGSLLSEVPSLEHKDASPHEGIPLKSSAENSIKGGIVIQEHVLEFLLTMNHFEEADNRVPTCVSNLLVHIIETHVDQLQDIVTKLEMDLDDAERELDSGGYVVRQEMLNDRLFPKIHLDIQRLLQVISYGEQVFPRVKEKCSGKQWSIPEDMMTLDMLVGRLQKLKENVGFLANRITALQASLDSWQSEQINRKLYYISFLSIIFLPLSIITAAFGMNVGGVPWTEQRDPSPSDGFRNVLFLCAFVLLLLLLCFCAGPLYSYLKTWQLRQAVRTKWMSTKKSMKWRRNHQNLQQHEGYLRL